MSRILTVTSGKGGVGKTNLSLNLALCLTKMGHRTCLFDADLGLANINILLGLYPEYNLKDLLFDGHDLKEIIIRIKDGLDILPGASGVEEMANLGPDQVDTLIQSFAAMDQYEFLIFDTSAGISRNVISFCLASTEVILVITPEPTSMIDAFALLKVLYLNGFTGEAKMVLNQYRTSESGKQAFVRFSSAVAEHLGKKLVALGMIPEDGKVIESVRIQQPLQSAFPGSAAAKCIGKISERLVAKQEASSDLDVVSFWRRFFQSVRGPLRLPKKVTKKQPETLPPPSMQERTVLQPQGLDAMSLSVAPKQAQADDQRQAEASQKPSSMGLGREEGLIAHSLPVLERLVESVSSVSREIQLVREMIADNGTALFHRNNGSKVADDNSSLLKPIRLNLEDFVVRLQTENKE
jgi:flagellar biosynthesis protein FlhG